MKWFRSPSARCPAHQARPALEMLEDRAVPATFVTEQAGVLHVWGDAGVNKVEIKDSGTNAPGNIRFRLDSSLSYEDDVSPWRHSQSAIRSIIVHAGSGNDIVRYRLTSPLASGVSHRIRAELGAGNDIYWGEVRGRMLTSSELWMTALGEGNNDQLAAFGFDDLERDADLRIGFYGGAGHDNIWGLMDNDVDIAQDAKLNMYLRGESGNDTFGVNYAGDLHGQLQLNLAGGLGCDTADVLFSLSAASTGTVGDPNGQRAVVAGNSHMDRLNFRVLNPNPDDSAQVYADLDVDRGEAWTKTPNVRLI